MAQRNHARESTSTVVFGALTTSWESASVPVYFPGGGLLASVSFPVARVGSEGVCLMSLRVIVGARAGVLQDGWDRRLVCGLHAADEVGDAGAVELDRSAVRRVARGDHAVACYANGLVGIGEADVADGLHGPSEGNGDCLCRECRLPQQLR